MRKILKNDYALSVFSKVVTIIVGLLSSSFSTRFLGVAYKGEYAFIIQVVNVAVLLVNLGLYQSYAYNYRKSGNEILPKYMAVFCTQFAIYFVIAAAISGVTMNFQIFMISLLTPFQVLRVQLDNIMLVQNVRLRLFSNIFSTVGLMLCYMALYFFVPSGVFPVVCVTVAIDIAVILTYFIRCSITPQIKSLDLKFTGSILRFGFLPMLSALLVTLNYSVDIFFLKRLGTGTELSMYSIAAGIMNYVWLVPDAFKDIIFSRVARNDKKNSVAFSVKAALLFLVVTTIGFVILGKIFITIMYGKAFLPAYGVTLVLFLGVFSMIFFKIFGIVFLAEGRRIPHFVFLLISVILNIILNAALIPQYGMYGAAIASVGSYNVCGLLFLFFYAKVKGEKVRSLILINKTDISNVKKLIGRNGS